MRASVLNYPGQKRRHSALPHRADSDLAGAAGRFQHLAVAQVDGDVLAAARAVEDEVATFGLRRRNVPTRVVLIPGEPRQQPAHPGEAVPDQSRAVEADGV